ncbi:phage terminase large subunit [Clostridium beijerinckii]|uniref:phage terminase large subunit n=2 Tax=Clostridium beijerinckii TaxID=1520 RepID=UPI001FAD37E3|nr:phage terminase large subunit [Clostridium beijerinckii]
MIKVKLKSIIASSFYDAHKDIKQGLHTHYWFKGGRGSTKSSFISLEIVLGIMKDAQEGIFSNGLVIRRVKETLRESVYDQIKWAIYTLGVQDEWEVPESKLRITYKPTGQAILFRGADKPQKLKSTKVSKGWIKYIWYEEVAILRAQNIMHVKNKDEMIKEVKKKKEAYSDNGESNEIEYEFQFAWDRQATFLNAQSRAMAELRSLIKQYDEMLHVNWDLATEEQKLRINKLKADIDKSTGKDDGNNDLAKAVLQAMNKRNGGSNE